MRSPSACHVGLLIVTEVVDVGESEEHFFARRLHAEPFQREASVRSRSCLDVAKERGEVFFLQLDIHHQALVAHVPLHETRVLTFPIINLYLAHSIRRQILQCHLRIAAEEIPAVDKQTLDEPPVDKYLSVSRQPCPRQSGDECVEHAAFRQIEGIGIIHNRITAHHHLYLRSLDGHLLQFVNIMLHQYGLGYQHGLPLTLQRHVLISVLVA